MPTTSRPKPGPSARSSRPSRVAPWPRTGEVLLGGAEVVHVAELDVGHRRAGGDRDAERVRGKRAARVQRAVERIDDDARPRTPSSPKATSPRSSEIAVNCVALGVQALELGEDDVLAVAVDGERAVAALADSRVDGARRRSRCCSANSSRCAATIRRQAASQSISARVRARRGAAPFGGLLARHVAMLEGAVPGSGDAGPPVMLPRLASVRPMEGDPAGLGCGSRTPSDGWSSTAYGAMLVVGAAGSGRSEALAARLARLAPRGPLPSGSWC